MEKMDPKTVKGEESDLGECEISMSTGHFRDDQENKIPNFSNNIEHLIGNKRVWSLKTF